MHDPSGRPGGLPPTALIAHRGAELFTSDRVMLQTAAALIDSGWRVVVTVPSLGPLVAEARRIGAETVVVRAPVLRKRILNPRRLVPFVLSSMTAWRRVARVLRDIRPDVVYVSTLTLPVWIAAGRVRSIPVVAHVHEGEPHALRPIRSLIAAPLLLADRVVVNSEFNRDGLVTAIHGLAKRSVVIGDGIVPPEAVHETRDRIDGALRVGFVGRLSPRHGVDVAVHAIAALTARGQACSLELAGSVFDGYEWYETLIRTEVDRLGLSSLVRFTGFQQSVWDVLDRADVVVVPARDGEPSGHVAAEAALAGRPMIISSVGGLAEAVDGFVSAVHVPADDPSALADALERVARNWPAFRRTARTFTPIAAQRFSAEVYRLKIVAEIGGVARIPPEHALAS